jgi:hypothetical protein
MTEKRQIFNFRISLSDDENNELPDLAIDAGAIY